MALTAEQIKAREGRLTASAVGALMSGNQTKIMNLWREMIGDPNYVPEDLSGVWPVQLGSATEFLNLRWYERKTGRTLSREGEVVVHPEYDWAAATLDGFDEEAGRVVECKHVGGRESLATVHDRYMPQIHWQLIVCKHIGAREGVFSIIEGSQAPKLDVVQFDAAYGAELWRRAEHFMGCVNTMTPPFATEATAVEASALHEGPVAAPPPAKVYDMDGQNQWAAEADTWLKNVDAGKLADAAEVALKALMPADAKHSHGYGVEIVRDRGGKLKLKKLGG